MKSNDTAFTPIPQQNILHEILGQFERNIRDGTLKKGDRLPSERQMEEIFGVSRTTVREVIKSLELMGLVECVQGNGNYIARSMDKSLVQPLSLMFMLENGTLSQIQQLRRSLEINNAGFAAQSITPAKLEALHGLCGKMEQDLPQAALAKYDTQFHAHIITAVNNPLIVVIFNAVEALFNAQIENVRERMMNSADRMKHINRHHREIVANLERGDAEGCIGAMVCHMDYVEDFIADNC